MSDITVDTWLYGDLARYGGQADKGSYANLQVRLQAGRTVNDLLAYLTMRTEARGITFINGQLSAMPGLQPEDRGEPGHRIRPVKEVELPGGRHDQLVGNVIVGVYGRTRIGVDGRPVVEVRRGDRGGQSLDVGGVGMRVEH